jgi:predicted transcriptional regulator YheO
MNLLSLRYGLVCKLISELFPGQIEAVLHDLKSGQIALIEGAYSNREIGDASLIDIENLLNDTNENGLIGPYSKTNWDGEQLRSYTAVLNDDKNRPIGLLCVNCRTAAFSAAAELLTAISQTTIERQPKALLINDWRDAINQLIKQTLTELSTTLIMSTRSDKVLIIKALNQLGFLDFRGSPEYVAKSLGISRASFYNLLKDSRRDKSNTSPDQPIEEA